MPTNDRTDLTPAPAPSRRLSLRQRLLLWLLPPLLLLTIVWALGVYGVVLHFTHIAYDRALEDAAQSLAGQVRVRDGKAEIDLPPAAMEMLEFDQVDSVFFSVVDANGRQLFGNRSLPIPTDNNAPPHSTRFYDDKLGAREIRVAEYHVPTDSESGVVLVRVAETVNKRSMLVREVFRFVMLPQLLFIVCVSALIWYGVGRGMAPVSLIRDAIARRTHTDLSPLKDAGLPAEIQEQVRVINDLMNRLGKTITTQQRFIADATHQLRTPITVLRTQAELALRIEDPDELRAAMAKLDAATARLVRLANQLLNLSRAEAGVDEIDVDDVDVADLVDDVVADLVPAALARQIDVTLDASPTLGSLRGNRLYLKEMLMNLVDNAVRYTPAGGHVRVEAIRSAGQVVLRVIDDGPGIAESDLDKVLGRFYRSASAASGGSGLGLSIANEIALLHAGSITLSRGEHDLGLIATVSLPLSAALTPAAASSHR